MSKRIERGRPSHQLPFRYIDVRPLSSISSLDAHTGPTIDHSPETVGALTATAALKAGRDDRAMARWIPNMIEMLSRNAEQLVSSFGRAEFLCGEVGRLT